MIKLKRENWPEPLKHVHEVRCVVVGPCKNDRRQGARANVAAHVHFDTGQICFSSDQWVNNEYVVLHELAHLLEPSDLDHGSSWRSRLLDLLTIYDVEPDINFTVERRYHGNV
jgi:hypothetical protein